MVEVNMKRGVVNKKGLSPIISTSILIVIVVILAIIILLWARGFVEEAVIKEIAGNSKRAEDFCKELKIKGIVNQDDSFGFENTGTIPIYAYRVNLQKGGSSSTLRIGADDGGSVNPGFTVIVPANEVEPYSTYESVRIIPVLLGKVEGSTQEFDCPEINGIDI
jgi:flagellin-like protein